MIISQNTVESNFENYCYRLDLDYLLDIVNNLSFCEFEGILCQLLKSQDRETISNTCWVIRDLIVCYSNRYDEFAEFGEKYPQSDIVNSLESLLYSSDRSSVKDAIYTLGKTCSYSSVDALSKAFYHLQDIDPLILPRWFCEMQWLGGLEDHFWDFIDSMMSSKVYCTRWAVINELPTFVDKDGEEKHILSQEESKYLETLKKDSNEFIRLEAQHKCERLLFKKVCQDLPKKERNKRRKDLEKQYQSLFNFEYLCLVFNNYLAHKKLDNYTISELETFIDYFSFFKKQC